jgi:hypothetical protein
LCVQGLNYFEAQKTILTAGTANDIKAIIRHHFVQLFFTIWIKCHFLSDLMKVLF